MGTNREDKLEADIGNRHREDKLGGQTVGTNREDKLGGHIGRTNWEDKLGGQIGGGQLGRTNWEQTSETEIHFLVDVRTPKALRRLGDLVLDSKAPQGARGPYIGFWSGNGAQTGIVHAVTYPNRWNNIYDVGNR